MLGSDVVGGGLGRVRLTEQTSSAVRGLMVAFAVGGHEPRSTADLYTLSESLPPEFISACSLPAEGVGYRVVSGLSVDAGLLGPTPDPVAPAACPSSAGASQWDALMTALALRLGRPLTWPHLKGGRVVTDVAPSPGMAVEQSGSSSEVTFSLHTEDAFHPGRAHVLILASLRNPQQTPTYVSSVRDVELDAADWAALQRHRAPIYPDASYFSRCATDRAGAAAVATAWDRAGHRCLRFDRAHTDFSDSPTGFRQAHARLARQLEERRQVIPLHPGELLVLDNDVVVHGRAPFPARYDGTDRWLKRVIVRVPGNYRPPVSEAEDGYGQSLQEFVPVVD